MSARRHAGTPGSSRSMTIHYRLILSGHVARLPYPHSRCLRHSLQLLLGTSALFLYTSETPSSAPATSTSSGHVRQWESSCQTRSGSGPLSACHHCSNRAQLVCMGADLHRGAQCTGPERSIIIVIIVIPERSIIIVIIV